MKLEQLSDKMDSMLLLEFRQTYWDNWVKFCKFQGYEPEVEQ